MRSSGKRSFRAVLVALLTFAMTVTLAGRNDITAQAESRKDVAILYFSATGTTKSIAEKIKKNTKGKLVEIKAAEPYLKKDLDWNDDSSRVSEEHESADSPAESSVRPKIKNLKAIRQAVKKADTVYIGYPIWWGEAPHILYSLVEKVSLEGKTVIPFCTSASSGVGDSSENLKTKAIISSKTRWMPGHGFYGRSSQKKVNQWIKKLK